jgi:hypothetical protein
MLTQSTHLTALGHCVNFFYFAQFIDGSELHILNTDIQIFKISQVLLCLTHRQHGKKLSYTIYIYIVLQLFESGFCVTWWDLNYRWVGYYHYDLLTNALFITKACVLRTMSHSNNWFQNNLNISSCELGKFMHILASDSEVVQFQ